MVEEPVALTAGLGNLMRKVEVYAIKIDTKLDGQLFENLLSFVSQEKSNRIKRFYKYEDSLRTLLGDVLARYLICQKVNLPNGLLRFGKNEYGKPFLINDPGVCFNISHSGEWVVCALGNAPVGVDVEKVAPTDFEIGGRFFSPNEYWELLQRKGLAKLLYFYEVWTLKESYIKAVGKGMSIPVQTVSVLGDCVINNEAGTVNVYFKKYDINSEYKVAVCAAGKAFEDQIKYLDVAEVKAGLTEHSS